jgi:hypothetical protein
MILSGDEAIAIQWGEPTDIPVPGDFDGDGVTDLAVWRPETGVWNVILSGGGEIAQQWGDPTDVPLSSLTPVFEAAP